MSTVYSLLFTVTFSPLNIFWSKSEDRRTTIYIAQNISFRGSQQNKKVGFRKSKPDYPIHRV